MFSLLKSFCLPHLLLYRYGALRLLWVLMGLSAQRLVFCMMYAQSLELQSPQAYIPIALAGLRFDLSAALSLLLPWWILSLLLATYQPANSQPTTGQRLLCTLTDCLYYLAVVALFVPNSIDLGYFPFSGKRLSADFFSTSTRWADLLAPLPHYLQDYAGLFAGTAGLVVLVAYLNYRCASTQSLCPQSPQTSLASLAPPRPLCTAAAAYALRGMFLVTALAATILGIRGGLQRKPLSPLHSYVHAKVPGQAVAVLNTPFCLLHSRKAALPEVNDWFASPRLAAAHFNPYQQLTGEAFRPLNVVILIVESLSAEYVGVLNEDLPDCPSYTPYLDARLRQAGWYTQGYANGRTSVEALPAILASLPSWMPQPFIRSGYNQRPVHSLAHYLKPHGYTSAFYHGGHNGTMGFDVFCKASGIDHYIGFNEYPGPSQDHDGCWGIYDEPFLQFVVQHLSQLPVPFLGTVFTLSSHHPYRVPESMNALEPPLRQGPLPLHRSIAYTDYALEQFFRAAAQQAWFAHTLFVLVADHPSLVQHPAYQDTACPHHRIPIVFYHPANPQLKGHWGGIAQQTDILPSILHYLGYAGPVTAFGTSIWQDSPQQRFALTYDGGHYCLRSPQSLLVATPHQVLYPSSDLPGTLTESSKQAHDQLRALLYLYSRWLRQDLPESATGRWAVAPCSAPVFGYPDGFQSQE